MYKDKRILALIPARGGSKGIKNKNIIDLCGKPLIAYSIDAAKGSRYIDEIFVSTDSSKIANVSEKYGVKVPFLRPDYLATDESRTIDAVLHTITSLKKAGKSFDVLVLLQPTQPLRSAEDIDSAIELFFDSNNIGVVSISPVDDNPILIRTIADDGKLKKILNVSSTCRRQDMPVFYRVNGCIYINLIDELSENTSFNDNEIPYLMTSEHSVDIDELKDLALAEYYLKKTEID